MARALVWETSPGTEVAHKRHAEPAREGMSDGSLRCSAESSEQQSVSSLRLGGELVDGSEAQYPLAGVGIGAGLARNSANPLPGEISRPPHRILGSGNIKVRKDQ